jgi:trans-aconitate methyltransferase
MPDNIYKNRLFVVSKNRNQQFLSRVARVLKPNISVLDIGCGDGSILEYLKRRVKDFYYTGVDISEANINSAVSRYSSTTCNFVCKDYLGYRPSHNFDIIISYSALNLIPETERVFRKISSELSCVRGGLVLGLPYDCLRTRFYIAIRKLLKKLNIDFSNSQIASICSHLLSSRYSYEEIKQSLIYMTMPPTFVYNNSSPHRALLYGLRLVDEQVEYPNVLGKLSHKIVAFRR